MYLVNPASYRCSCFLRLPTGGLLEIAKVYPLDAVFDTPEDVPEDVSGTAPSMLH